MRNILLHLCLAAALIASAQAQPERHTAKVGLIPAPTAQSPGRSAAIALLRKRGKAEAELGRAMASDGCDYAFDAKVLLDTPVFFSLRLSTVFTCNSTTTSYEALVLDMTTGREYDVNRLYHVLDEERRLLPTVRRLAAIRADTRDSGRSEAETRDDIEEGFARTDALLFVTGTGIRPWPGGQALGHDIALTWADLRPYLDVGEAKRIGWPYQ